MKGNSRLEAIVFDMDGVLVDSNPYHIQNWMKFLDARGIPYDPAALPRQVLGIRNDKSFPTFFGSDKSDAELDRLSNELEAGFRRSFQGHANPQTGVLALIEECREAGIPMAVASSAPPENVHFIVDALKLRPNFRSVLTGAEVTHPKPHPEIYLKSAAKLGVEPARCVAFEDSFTGLESASRAGMKVVAIASTFPRAELKAHGHADLIVDSFEELSLGSLRQLFGE
jgi:HAD superfamily hydrolase (TIGR01509 family)